MLHDLTAEIDPFPRPNQRRLLAASKSHRSRVAWLRCRPWNGEGPRAGMLRRDQPGLVKASEKGKWRCRANQDTDELDRVAGGGMDVLKGRLHKDEVEWKKEQKGEPAV